ncbi:MAG: hypothetical protein ACE5JA_02865 [bacterium]
MEESLFGSFEAVSLWWQIRTAEQTWWDKFALEDPFGRESDVSETDEPELDLFAVAEMEFTVQSS